MKRKMCFLIFVTVAFESFIHADAFTDALQDLAMMTACQGLYSCTEAGHYNIPDPHDYYTPNLLAVRFAVMSGQRTMTQTFYGVCFDYAQAAWDTIKREQLRFNSVGMENQEWYLACTDDNPNVITLYDPIPENRVRRNGYGYVDSRDGQYLRYSNGVYCKEQTSMYVSAHGGATYHAWIWLKWDDGTWYWIDPTWTDNCGYVVYGYVSGGREVQLVPSDEYCVVTPPSSGSGNGGDNSGGGNYRPTLPQPSYSFDSDFDTRREDGDFWCVLSGGVLFGTDALSGVESGEYESSVYGFAVGLELGDKFRFPFILQADFLTDDETSAILLGGDLGLQLWRFTFYGGGGFGCSCGDGLDSEEYSPVWKVNAGIRLTLGCAFRFDIAYVKDYGSICGIFLGLGF